MSTSNRKPSGGRVYAISVKDAASWLRDYVTAIKHGQFHPYTPLERKVREATRNEAWGPTGTLLNELAEASCDSDMCQIIYAVLETRLQYPPEKWRNVYKALQVLEFLMKRGSDQCVKLAQSEIRPHLQSVKNFEFTGNDGRDYGTNVRIRAVAIERLLENDQELQQERAQLQHRAKQFVGFSRQELENKEVMEDAARRASSWPSVHDDTNTSHCCTKPDQEHVGGVVGRSRRAGEMKGVSEEENRKHLQILKALLANHNNRHCADCISDERPSWASINCGVFLCVKCAGIHRGLGVHISQVRSCVLDMWRPADVKFMSQTGNRLANGFWEAKLASKLKPRSDDPSLLNFIVRKYKHREWAAGEWPPKSDTGQSTSSKNRAGSTSRKYLVERPSAGKWHHSRPPCGGAFGVPPPSLDIRGGPFEEAASEMDRMVLSAGYSEAAPKPSHSAPTPIRALSADPLGRPVAVAAGTPNPPGSPALTGMLRTHTYPDMLGCETDTDVGNAAPQPHPVKPRGLPTGKQLQVSPLAVVDNSSQLPDWMYEPGGVTGRSAAEESVDSADVIHTTEFRDEEPDVIQTTELNLDELETTAIPNVASADGCLQSPMQSDPMWIEEHIRWMDMQDMKASSHGRHSPSPGWSPAQKRDSRQWYNKNHGAAGDTHVSVTLNMNNRQKEGGFAHSQAVYVSNFDVNNRPATVHTAIVDVRPGLSPDRVASLKYVAPNPHNDNVKASAATASTRRGSRESYCYELTGKFYSAGHFNVPDAPVLDSPGDHAGMTTPCYQTVNPISDHQPPRQWMGGAVEDSRWSPQDSSASIGCSAAHSVPSQTNPFLMADAFEDGDCNHTIVGNVYSGTPGEGVYSARQFSQKPVAHRQARSCMSSRPAVAPAHHQAVSKAHHGHYAGSLTSHTRHSMEKQKAGGYSTMNTQQQELSQGRYSYGGDASSSGASDDVERIFVDKVEGMAREGENARAQMSAGSFSSQQRMSIMEMCTEVEKTPHRPSSESRTRPLSMRGEQSVSLNPLPWDM